MAAFPTHDDLTLVIVGLPEDDFNAARSDVEGTTFVRASTWRRRWVIA